MEPGTSCRLNEVIPVSHFSVSKKMSAHLLNYPQACVIAVVAIALILMTFQGNSLIPLVALGVCVVVIPGSNHIKALMDLVQKASTPVLSKEEVEENVRQMAADERLNIELLENKINCFDDFVCKRSDLKELCLKQLNGNFEAHGFVRYQVNSEHGEWAQLASKRVVLEHNLQARMDFVLIHPEILQCFLKHCKIDIQPDYLLITDK